jgi:hypothetical protein
MTIPIERSYAIENTREFLRSLLDPKQTPRIPKEIRKQAYWCLRHFPHDFEMEKAREKCPEIFGDNKNE